MYLIKWSPVVVETGSHSRKMFGIKPKKFFPENSRRCVEDKVCVQIHHGVYLWENQRQEESFCGTNAEHLLHIHPVFRIPHGMVLEMKSIFECFGPVICRTNKTVEQILLTTDYIPAIIILLNCKIIVNKYHCI